MDNKNTRRRLSPRVIAIIVLALVVLAEGAFLLLHRRADDTAKGGNTAAETAAPAKESGAPAETTAVPEAEAAEQAAATETPAASAAPSAAPAQTPAVTIAPENQGKAYAGAIALVENYARSPSEGTISYLLGGELLGDQMARFLPALLTMGGQSVDLMKEEMDVSLNLPAGTTSLTVTGEQAIAANDLNAAREKVREMEKSFTAIADSFGDYGAFTDAEWNAIGSELGISGAEAKRLLTEIGDSARTMAGMLSGADVTEGYVVSMTTNTGAAMVTNVYRVAGKWVTSTFFDMQFT